MNTIQKEFTELMQEKGLNYHNVKQVNLIIYAENGVKCGLLMNESIDIIKEQLDMQHFMQSVKPTDAIKGWISFDNGGWIERNEMGGVDYWEYKICPKWEV